MNLAMSSGGRSLVARADAVVPLPADRLWALAKRTATQLYLSRQGFSYGADLPEVRHEGYTGSHRLRLFGVVPAWTHTQRFERVSDEDREIVVRERGGPYRRWDHSMRIEPLTDGSCRFVDAIEVEAGPLTPVVWVAAALLCRSRMRRLRELARVLA